MKIYRMRVGYNKWDDDKPREHNVWVLVLWGNPKDAACRKAEIMRRLMFDWSYQSYYAYHNPIDWKRLFKTVAI